MFNGVRSAQTLVAFGPFIQLPEQHIRRECNLKRPLASSVQLVCVFVFVFQQELLQFEGLKSLYLHGNKLIDVGEVDKLAKLKNLQALTIHGNPIETVNGCRHYILAKLPLLKHLNFSGISKADRATATVWTKSNRRPPIVEVGEKKVAARRNSTEEDN